MTDLKISVKIQLFTRRKYIQFTSPNLDMVKTSRQYTRENIVFDRTDRPTNRPIDPPTHRSLGTDMPTPTPLYTSSWELNGCTMYAYLYQHTIIMLVLIIPATFMKNCRYLANNIVLFSKCLRMSALVVPVHSVKRIWSKDKFFRSHFVEHHFFEKNRIILINEK